MISYTLLSCAEHEGDISKPRGVYSDSTFMIISK